MRRRPAFRLVHRGRVPVAAPEHLPRKLFVPPEDKARIDEPSGEEAVDALSAFHGSEKHVQLDMFPEQVLAAHRFRGKHPHPHVRLLFAERMRGRAPGQ